MNGGLTRWVVNLVSFILLVLLALTGLASWWLPHGAGAGIQTLRHFLHSVHRTGAVFFIAAIGIHIWLHWGYVRQRLMTLGIGPLRNIPPTDRKRV
jgi:TRAP-type mannitol/chloroaromatic compound transport system permease small subunit